MKVTRKMLAPDLRFCGSLLRPFTQVRNPSVFKWQQWLTEKVYRGQMPSDPQIVFKETFISNEDGERMRIFIYKPRHLDPSQPVTGLLWLHGGGYAIGLPEQELPTIERFIQTNPCVVIAPDYRRSLVAPFPAALNDAYATLLWMKENAKKLGIRTDQLFVGGESAGGGLTCCVSAYARDHGTVQIAYQIPLYPMLDDRMLTASNNGPVWNETSNRTAWRLYLGQSTAKTSVYAAPARLQNFRNLPPTYTFVSDIEPFYDETRQYINHLKQAGVPAIMTVCPGGFHAFDRFVPKSKLAEFATIDLLNHYRQATERYFKEQTD